MTSPRPTSPRRFALCAGIVALALGAAVSTRAYASPESEAKEHFKAGVRHLQDPDGARYEDAYREFRAAFAATPNPKILGNVGFCAMKLERDGEAIAAYTRYLAEVSDIDPDERDQITKDLQAMSSGLVHLTVEVAASVGPVTVTDTRTPVTGSPVVNAYGPFTGKLELGVRPGRHALRVRTAAGDESKSWELDVAPGTKTTHSFAVIPAEEARKPIGFGRPVEQPPRSQAAPWLVTSLGGAMLVTGAVTGIVVMNKVSRLESRCPNDTCPAGSGLDAERDSIKRLTRVTDVLLVSGAVVASTGIVWLILSGSSTRSEDAAVKTAGIAPPDLGCSGNGCAFTLTGSF
jgi:hypothetical protein